MSLTLDLHIDAHRLQSALQRAPRALHNNISRALMRIINDIANSAKLDAPKASSALTHSIIPRMTDPLGGEVRAGMNYASYVEYPTRPSGRLPPVADILSWVRVKQIVPRDPGMDQRDLAWAIARSIARRGIPAQPYLYPAARANEAQAQSRIARAIDQVLEGMSS